MQKRFLVIGELVLVLAFVSLGWVIWPIEGSMTVHLVTTGTLLLSYSLFAYSMWVTFPYES